jgi:tight adherence protein C
MSLLLFLGFICLAGAVFVVAETATLPARQRRELLRRAAQYGARPTVAVIEDPSKQSFGQRVFAPVIHTVANFVLRVTPKATKQQTAQRLLAAGVGARVTPEQFLAMKGLGAVAGVIAGMLLGGALGGIAPIALALGFAAIGFIGPDRFVNGRASRRRERIQAALPDALDLLAVSVEAGLGFDGAVAKLTEYSEGPLGEEFALTLNEMRIGESRTDALKRMAGRVDAPELATFVRAIVQADQLGMSIGNILRTQAGDARVRRQLDAEEKAMKAPVKMLFPTVLFIFPAMFIVILGPAVLNFGKVF